MYSEEILQPKSASEVARSLTLAGSWEKEATLFLLGPFVKSRYGVIPL